MLKSALTLSLFATMIALAATHTQALMSRSNADMAKMEAIVDEMTDTTKRQEMLKEVETVAKDERGCMAHRKNVASTTSKLQPTTRADHGVHQAPRGPVLPPCYPVEEGAAYIS